MDRSKSRHDPALLADVAYRTLTIRELHARLFRTRDETVLVWMPLLQIVGGTIVDHEPITMAQLKQLVLVTAPRRSSFLPRKCN
jgi:hypothetical protein